jgi:hypothetical protein
MSHLALHGQSYPCDFAERHVWTAQDNRELAAFIAQVTCIVAAAVVLYALGPAVGLLSAAGCLAVWALLRRSAGTANENAGTANQKESADCSASAETSLTNGGGRRPDGDRSPRRNLDKTVRLGA